MGILRGIYLGGSPGDPLGESFPGSPPLPLGIPRRIPPCIPLRASPGGSPWGSFGVTPWGGRSLPSCLPDLGLMSSLAQCAFLGEELRVAWILLLLPFS